jgi:uncharacterized protein with HEPN domain
MIEVKQYLQDILVYLDDIEVFTHDGRAAFAADRKTQFAVIRAYEVVGEIVKRLPSDLLETQPDIAWQDIKAFRDFLAHNYEKVKTDIIWGAVEKMPALRSAVAAMLKAVSETDHSE